VSNANISTPFEPTWESLSNFKVPSWYQDAKFGIFIHWGLYSVAAFDNEWYPRNMYLQETRAFEHHQRVWGPNFGYKDFIPMFKAEHFDPDVWADLFRRAGAKYVVPVAEHHDGFAMYDCSYSRWTAAKMGPKRDLIGELATAIRKQDLIFGLSTHRAEHWWFMNGGKEYPSDVQDEAYSDFYGPAHPGPRLFAEGWDSKDWHPRPDAKYLDDWFARTCELVDKYQPSLVYFDWWIQQIVFSPYLQRFAAYYYNQGASWNREVAINCKNDAFPDGTVVFDVERGKLAELRPLFWQTDTSVSDNSWCYIEDHKYKTSTSLIHDLIDIVSKNGTLLLNIGPRPDGTIPEPEQQILLDIGKWLSVNGEAIYGTRPWKIYGEGPTEVVEGSFQEGKGTAFTAQDIRFTTKGNTLYAIALGQPETKNLTIRSLGIDSQLHSQTINQVSVLGSSEQLQWTRESKGLIIQLPDQPMNSPALVFKIE
jgi:alpha-L-fucosidase